MKTKSARAIRFGTIAGLGLLIGFLILLRTVLKVEVLQEQLSHIGGAWFFLLLCLLPLIGFPVSILYVLAGLRYGNLWGVIFTSLSIAVNLLATYGVARGLFQKPLMRLLARRWPSLPQIPKKEHRSVTLLTALVPGLSFTLKNYLLVLAGIGLGPFFWICWPIHTAHAILGIFLGDAVHHLTVGKVIFLVVYGVGMTWWCSRLVRRIRSEIKHDPFAEVTSVPIAPEAP